MKKIYKMQDLDCANCAAKMEAAIGKLPGVESVVISFMTQKMTIVTTDDDHEHIMDEAAKICRRVEPDCRIIR